MDDAPTVARPQKPCCPAGPARAAASMSAARRKLIRRAFGLEWASLAWMSIEALVAIASGVAAGSVCLLAFGLDSVIELASAGVLVWRLTVELRRGEVFAEATERLASRIAGSLLLALAATIVGVAAWKLTTRAGESFSWPGLIVAALAMPIMAVLARRKLAVADALGSPAMRADAMESLTCGWLSLAVVAGLIVQALSGAWWVDAVTSLGIVGLLIREGLEAWRGEPCCCD